jgi:hypothetical protein
VPRSRLGTVPRLVVAPCVTSDRAHSVNFAAVDFAGVAALGPRQAADLLRQASSAAWGPGFV